LSSLDISRRTLALRGREIFGRVSSIARYAREEINKIGGYYAYADELIDGKAVFDFDITKLSVYTRDIGLAGIEVYDILRDEYGIQIEFGDIGNILAIISVGDSDLSIERLISALYEIKRRFEKDKRECSTMNIYLPLWSLPFKKHLMRIKNPSTLQTRGQNKRGICKCYPPGIPILARASESPRNNRLYKVCQRTKAVS
jgi:arginine/lysine/ornithine decarboxylase